MKGKADPGEAAREARVPGRRKDPPPAGEAHARSTSRRAQRTLQVEFLACADSLNGPAMAAIDALAVANAIAHMRGRRRAAFGWQWTRPDGRAGARGLPASGLRRRMPDLLIVPGWQARNGPHLDKLVQRDRAACERLRDAHAAGSHVLGVYTGVALLGAAGLLDDREAVAPWPFVAPVLRSAPTLRLIAGEAWVCNERVWSCDSPILVTEVLLEMIRALGLQPLADSVGHVLVHSRERQQLSGMVAAGGTARVGPGALERARRWLEANLDRPYSLEQTARAAATSRRSLLRHFRAAFGRTPLQYLHEVRATRARMLLETTYLSVDSVAELCGYRDTAMFRRVFTRESGLSPSAYRERFRLRTSRREWGRDLPDTLAR